MNTLQPGNAGLFAEVRQFNEIGEIGGRRNRRNRGQTTISAPAKSGTHHDFFALARAPSAHDIAFRIESARPEKSSCIPFCHIST